MIELVWPALVAGICLSLMSGALGVFIVWRRMAYFGDALSHTAFLGVAIGLLMHVPLPIPVLLLCLLAAAGLVVLQHYGKLSQDILLGILAHTALSLGLILASTRNTSMDLTAFLFGDILSIRAHDLSWIAPGSLLVVLCIKRLWRPLLKLTIHEEIASIEGVPVLKLKLMLTGLIAAVIAIAIKMVGVLLITSMLIIPAATARHLSKTPEQMALLSMLTGALAVVMGLALSISIDSPAGPSIVVSASGLFFIATLTSILRAVRQK